MSKLVSEQLKVRARELGFSLCGICPAVAPPGATRLAEWLAAGYAGKMHYIAGRQEAYQHPRHVLEGVRSIVMLGMNYATVLPAQPRVGQGRVSRYAWGKSDYHDLIRQRLHQLADSLRDLVPAAQTRGVVDTAPLLEREFAQMAGLGWVGKNTLLLSKKSGSYFFLAALLTDAPLSYDTAHLADHCGNCRACLDACPTDAFVEPYVLDASRCISYLTIELQEAIPMELRKGMGQWAFGCDVCQDVCPWNDVAPADAESAFQPEAEKNPLSLEALFDLDDDAFRRRFRHTPLWRSHRRGLLRNAAVVLGNQRAKSALGALGRGLADGEPIVRGASAWALGEIQAPAAKKLLMQRLEQEDDVEVEEELRAALAAY
ncbi:MAG: tRNA epoxyqueuosine(34) reductase QueG [Pirellulales bacterium]|nr:tRNA epoxyqueuosine(34) reductase QueG [Pirellulales bacterium]